MPDEVIVPGGAPAGGSDNGGGGGSAPPDLSKMSDSEALDSTIDQPIEKVGEGLAAKEAVPSGEKPADGAEKADAEEEVNLAALEEGAPEWLAKVTDPAVKAEVQKLIDLQKAFTAKFKDAEDLEAFFGELPGGRDQVAALQTLSKEVIDLDGKIAANTAEGNLEVTGRYLGEAPDGGVGLFRAAAQHLAKTNADGWNAISSELVNSTLKAAGIGTDIGGLLGAINEMRAAVSADDGEAFGKAAGKLLGAPQKETPSDPRIVDLQKREATVRAEAQKAQSDVYSFRSQKSGQGIDKHFASQVSPLLDKALPKSIPAQVRADLAGKVGQEIKSQMMSNAYLVSQVSQLIGPDGQPRFGATEADWKAVGELITKATTPALVRAAASKVVTEWSKSFVAKNAADIKKAKGGIVKQDVSGGTKTSVTKKPLTLADLEGPHAKSDKEILDSLI